MPPAPPAILLEAKRFLIIDKPAGIAVHPGPQTRNSLEDLLPLLTPSNRPAPMPVHRLDSDTSGCLLLARDRAALRALSAAFADGRIAKTYHAIMVNPPDSSEGVVDTPLAKRSSQFAGWRIVADTNGKPATTEWTVLARADNHALIRLKPKTGRTHQLRVHATMMARGCAIVGDPVYGTAHPLAMMLHAVTLTVPDQWEDPPQAKTARAPCPSRFRAFGLSWPD